VRPGAAGERIFYSLGQSDPHLNSGDARIPGRQRAPSLSTAHTASGLAAILAVAGGLRAIASHDRLTHGLVEALGAAVLLALVVGAGAGEADAGTGCGGTVAGTGTGGAVVGPPGGFASGDAGAGVLVVRTGCGGAVTVTTGRGTRVTRCGTGRPGAKPITGDGAATGPAAVLIRTCVTVLTCGLPGTISRRIRPGE
jgi:hypothetical protein